MKKQRIKIPVIPETERTPLVAALLGIIEGLAQQVQRQDEEIELLTHKSAI